MKVPNFCVISKEVVKNILEENQKLLVELIQQAYLTHGKEQSMNPNSMFIKFPDKPENRIIALPAWLGGSFNTAGMKWIASYPGNIDNGIPRASAVLILNDMSTGYPLACLEGSLISAYRTAISAVVGAQAMTQGNKKSKALALIGNGYIASKILQQFSLQGWSFDHIYLFDSILSHSNNFQSSNKKYFPSSHWEICDTSIEAIRKSDLITFATVSDKPYLHDPRLFHHNPTVLNISLRDLSPEILLESENYLDDIGHCLNAQTSPHLVFQKTGKKDFIQGTLYDVLLGKVSPNKQKTRIFSPFGLGILDLALGKLVYEMAINKDQSTQIENFFGLETSHA